MSIDVYRFGVPLSKSYTTTERGEKQYYMEGVASEETPDQQGETLMQAGMNFKPFLESGIVNWDHKGDPEYIIGEPVTAQIRPGGVFFVKARMYVDDNKHARDAWNIANAMQKAASNGGKRRLGWSVEGQTKQRHGSLILKSEIHHLALTHQPVHQNTWAAICKSMTTISAQPLQIENLDTQITDLLWGPCTGGHTCYAQNGYFTKGRIGMLHHLVACRGATPDAASRIIKRLIDSGI